VVANPRYYSGVHAARTTTSCVAAVAVYLTLTASPAGTQSAVADFPLRSQWSVRLASAPMFPPACDGVRAHILLRDGSLTAVSLEDGQPSWSVKVAAEAAPAAGDGLVFIGTKDAIEAHSSGNGEIRWRVALQGTLSAPLVWNTGWLIAATDRNEIVALRGLDGEILWRRPLSAATRIAPAPASRQLYVSLEDGHLVALAIETGSVVWNRRLGGPAGDVVALDGGLFVGSNDNYFYNLATRNGETTWRWRTGGDIIGAAAADLQRVYFISLDNELRALDRRGGALRWQRPVPIRPSAGPLLMGGTLIVAGVAAELRAYHTADGAPAGEFAVASPRGEELYFAAPPRVIQSPRAALIILTRDGLLQELVPAAP
jgi:outer membrane protein assembly factor BamB